MILIKIYSSKIINFFNNPKSAFLISFIIYLIFSIYGNDSIWKPSIHSYFNYLADAFLHGQFHFRLDPPTVHDLVLFDNKIYAYWPPFPAILLMPFIAIFGVDFSDILFTIFLGSANIALLSILLSELNKKNIIFLDPIKRGLLVIFFAFGTVYFTMVPLGRVWFTALVVGVFCVLITYLAATSIEGKWGFFLAGVGISAAMATRMHLLVVGLWPAWYLLSINWNKPKKEIIRNIIYGISPLLITSLFILYYNYSRFGNLFDVGLNYHVMGDIFRDEFYEYGAFNLYYLPKNFYYQFIAYPFFAKDAMTFFMGGSLFLLSPVFFAFFWAFLKKEKMSSKLILLFTILLTNIPILLLMGTGWLQFGPRYSLDYSIPLLILTALGIKNRPNRVILILVLISIVHYLFGLYMFIIKI